MMASDKRKQPWLDSAEALDYLSELGVPELDVERLLALCEAEQCMAWIDCRFALSPVSAEQLLVRRVRGGGHCQLLEADEVRLCAAAAGVAHLQVDGRVVVCGPAWVWSEDQVRPQKEEGIWRISLRHLSRPLLFRPAELDALAAQLRSGATACSGRRVSR